MASKSTSSSLAKSAPPTLLAFSFESLTPATYRVTRVAWSLEAYQIVAGLREALRSPAYDKPKELPIKDLRLRTQVYDPGVVRVNARLGIGHLLAEGDALNMLFTTSAPAEASEHANRAVAHWVDEAVKKIRGLKPMDARIAQGLRTLALNQQAIVTQADKVKVFQWATNEATNATLPQTATGFADLADYVAAQLVGKVIFPAAGPLRREIGSTLDKGYARLLTDPEVVPMGTEAPCSISLGLTITVATYPGRPLPVILLNMGKRVWTTGPKGRFFGNDLGGFVLPVGEDRAFKFSIDSHRLTLDDDYRAIAAGYPDLPAGDQLTAADLVRTGGNNPGSRVVVAAAPGRSAEKVAGRGVTDLDRQLAFERLTELLAPQGFTPWGGYLQRIETGAKTLNGLVGKWDVAHHTGTDEEKAKDQVLQEWTRELHAGLNQFYDGTHRILVAYQTGLHDDAARVEATLTKVLGPKGVVVTRVLLPDHVHGPRAWGPDGEKPAPPEERGKAKAAIWTLWIAGQVKQLTTKKQDLPHGIIVLARRNYGAGQYDDAISKQVGRVALIKGFAGANVQYLLPSAAAGATPSAAQLSKFQMRVLNGWRDLALKSVGRMPILPSRLVKRMPFMQQGNQPPVLLGAGIVRVNKTRERKNKTSFIPYVIELDPVSGECQATLLLRAAGSKQPVQPVSMRPLKQAVLALATHGPSYLAEHSSPQKVLVERQQLTEAFLHDVLLSRSKHHQGREIVLLADTSTLNGIWRWLADAQVNPADVRLHGLTEFQKALPNVTFVRLRHNHSPKALLPTEHVKVSFDQPDGTRSEPRLSARWADAKLYRLTDPSVGLPTYLSYGSRMFQPVRSASSYRPTHSVKGGKETPTAPFTKTWATPNPLEITVLQDPSQPARFQPDELAFLVETLRSSYDHFGGWTTLPGPLHFASVLKEYVPDYVMAEEEAAAKEEAKEEKE